MGLFMEETCGSHAWLEVHFEKSSSLEKKFQTRLSRLRQGQVTVTTSWTRP